MLRIILVTLQEFRGASPQTRGFTVHILSSSTLTVNMQFTMPNTSNAGNTSNSAISWLTVATCVPVLLYFNKSHHRHHESQR